MLNIRAIIALATGCLFVSNAPAEDSAIQLALVGFHAGADSVVPGNDWWGLYQDGKNYTLQPTSVTAVAVRNKLIDSESDESALQVETVPPSRPVLLIRGLDALQAGPVDSIDVTNHGGTLYPGQTVVLDHRLSGETERMKLSVTGVAMMKQERAYVEIRDYQIHVIAGYGKKFVKQTIAQFQSVADDAGPTLLWAGDVDRDGKLDLLLDLREHDLTTRPALFLSSAAAEGDLVKMVAHWLAWFNC